MSLASRLGAGGHGPEAAFAWLVRGFAVAGGVALVVMVATVVVAVVSRYLLNEPIFGAEDISAMALVVVVASAIVYGAWDNAHVAVDAIDSIAPKRATRVTDVVARLLGRGNGGDGGLSLVSARRMRSSLRRDDAKPANRPHALLLRARRRVRSHRRAAVDSPSGVVDASQRPAG